MEISHLKHMTKGWFIGDFAPSLLKTKDFEVGVKGYKAGEREDWHYHKIAREITVIASGKVEMCNAVFQTGDIIILEPGEGTSFRAIEDSITVVVKAPSVPNDKFLKT